MAKESLVRRVCNEDKSLASSGIQVALVEKLGEKKTNIKRHTIILLIDFHRLRSEHIEN